MVLFTVLGLIAAGGGALVVLSWPTDERPVPQAALPAASPAGGATAASSPLIGNDSAGARPRNIADLVRSGTPSAPASQLGAPLPTSEPSDNSADLLPADGASR